MLWTNSFREQRISFQLELETERAGSQIIHEISSLYKMPALLCATTQHWNKLSRHVLCRIPLLPLNTNSHESDIFISNCRFSDTAILCSLWLSKMAEKQNAVLQSTRTQPTHGLTHVNTVQSSQVSVKPFQLKLCFRGEVPGSTRIRFYTYPVLT